MDRDDVVGALDAFVDGANTSSTSARSTAASSSTTSHWGLYAEAVQSNGYRNAKIRTLLDTLAAVVGPSGSELDLQWVSPDGATHALRRRSWCAQASSGWLSSRPERAATGSPSWADCSGNGRRWTDTERGQMAKFGKRMTKFAKSPKGQKLLDKAKRKAKDPKARAKLEKKFGRKK